MGGMQACFCVDELFFGHAVQDYLFQYRAGIEAVTPQDILAAARRHLHPRQQAVVMAADASVFQPQLEAAGMRVLPLTVD